MYVSLKKRRIGINGFTLIELLVVIAIIGTLATLIAANLNSARTRARDVQRKSDLNQYRTSLEAYANINGGLYPDYSGGTTASDFLCTSLGLTACPDDPRRLTDSTYLRYQYRSDAGRINYVLWADLEATDYWVVCSNGKSGLLGSPPGSGTCTL